MITVGNRHKFYNFVLTALVSTYGELLTGNGVYHCIQQTR